MPSLCSKQITNLLAEAAAYEELSKSGDGDGSRDSVEGRGEDEGASRDCPLPLSDRGDREGGRMC